ncbi:hypothetical protein [Serratia sp. OPWLW2]|uniref:hypothetical protein n=1 Tax=Serratia sp. OPWLW2 TaxID=1928658 RepID=UPI000C173D08|nr:hypothetical protein [Serratia sp. OPWLW2]PIJ41214.1 hypothetical protein BOM25_16690 [Serratia sp. OPWLW2]
MDNKLSELSKPVAWAHRPEINAPIDVTENEYVARNWRDVHERNVQPLYSQEYVSALLAELEAKKQAHRVHAARLISERGVLRERVAEMESANKSQDDHINQQQDRIDSLEKTNAGLGRRLGDAEKRLATPVRLPRPACVYADHSYPAYSRKQVEEIITSAGMRFTVEGDE